MGPESHEIILDASFRSITDQALLSLPFFLSLLQPGVTTLLPLTPNWPSAPSRSILDTGLAVPKFSSSPFWLWSSRQTLWVESRTANGTYGTSFVYCCCFLHTSIMIQASLATHLRCFNTPSSLEHSIHFWGFPQCRLPGSSAFSPCERCLSWTLSLLTRFWRLFYFPTFFLPPWGQRGSLWGQRLYFLIVGSPGRLTGYTRYIPVKTCWTTINYTSLLQINERARKVILGSSLKKKKGRRFQYTQNTVRLLISYQQPVNYWASECNSKHYIHESCWQLGSSPRLLGYRTFIRDGLGTAPRMSKLTAVLDVTAGPTTQSRSLSFAGGLLMWMAQARVQPQGAGAPTVPGGIKKRILCEGCKRVVCAICMPLACCS